MSRELTRQLLLRLPFALLVTAACVLYIRWPCAGLNADSATFGIMGNDLLRRGYLPTLTYGQDYLFSITPYLYALVRWLAPAGLTPERALAIAGCLLAVGGLWLAFESLLSVQRRTGRPLFAAALVFGAVVAASPSYVMDLAETSSVELSLFLLGALMFGAARIEAARARGAAGCGGWFLLGAVIAHAVSSRPQTLLYAVVVVPALLLSARRRSVGQARDLRPLWAFAGGAALGCLPMLCHWLFRAAAWPFAYHVPVHFGTLSHIRRAAALLMREILPRIVSLDPAYPVHSVVVVATILAALGGYAWFSRRRRTQMSALDHAWLLGSVLSIAVMILYPKLAVAVGNRRYCLHVLLAVAWLAARFAVPARGAPLYACAGAAALALAVLPAWPGWLAGARAADEQVLAARPGIIPELARLDRLVLADYWDAYPLAFLADGHLRVECLPWQMVRTYGRYSPAEMTNAVWLVREGRGQSTLAALTAELGPQALAAIRSVPLQHALFGRPAELWMLQEGAAVELMNRHHPRYFTTPYPPGSRLPAAFAAGRTRRDRPQTAPPEAAP